MANNRCASYGHFRRVSIITFAILVTMNRLINAAAFMGIHRRHHHKWSSVLLHRRRKEHAVLPNLSRTRQSFSTNTKTRLMSTSNEYFLNLRIPTPEDMEDIGGLLSVNSTSGDIILLDGDLGAGKTCFSRGFVRGRTGLPNERVTSPTFLLSNTYPITDEHDGGGGDTTTITTTTTTATTLIHHMDLYRLSGSEDDLAPLNLEHVFANGISLIEWPSRLRRKPLMRLDITLTISNSTIQTNDIDGDDDTKERFMKLVPYGDRWVERLRFLNSEGYFEDLIVEPSIKERQIQYPE